jgi:hypothetical protein
VLAAKRAFHARPLAREMLPLFGMRTFMALVIAGGLGALFYYQKHHEPTNTADVKAGATAQPVHWTGAANNPPPRPVSEHNWMKRSLDRATEVRDQARAQTQQSQNP